eukprot:CAMPEP_0204528388 /NCGR_PEP_ID=MMETSP0661-20131031/9502_1 /ASSEMBLY_ACC=CAM_ASM_000606 /TAXON_ID=109239 /ORGANISM="Alexandrium margalefi, Strain AMGDE01CS-322" /LENGTH=269 /DNA_ID=CAMNT_0051534367 /DNA_START=53 /DNA_END=862 /DNA_ORIENTATION=-
MTKPSLAAPAEQQPQGAGAGEGRRTVGILALQGAFEEHEASFRRLPEELLRRIQLLQVRTPEELDRCDALVIPGGESTTMKIIAGCDDFMQRLRAYVHGSATRQPRPVWGTCAGCILLSDDEVNSLEGGGKEAEPAPKRCKYGEPVGGLAVSTCRNFFGRQAASFEARVAAAGEDKSYHHAFADFPAVFIRAPAILRMGDGARALARVRHPVLASASATAGSEEEEGVVVAAESSRILVTCFHPELAQDSRIHRYFVERFVLSAGGGEP